MPFLKKVTKTKFVLSLQTLSIAIVLLAYLPYVHSVTLKYFVFASVVAIVFGSTFKFLKKTEKPIALPKYIFYSSLFAIVASLLTVIFSASASNSLFGSFLFQNGTAITTILLFIAMFNSYVLSKDKTLIYKTINAFLVAFSVLVVLFFANLFGVFQWLGVAPVFNYFLSFEELGILAGLVAIISSLAIVFKEQVQPAIKMYISIIALVMSILLLLVVSFKTVWISTALFSLFIFVLLVFTRTIDPEKPIHVQNKLFVLKTLPIIVLFLISFTMIVNPRIIPLSFNFSEIKPSLNADLDLFKQIGSKGSVLRYATGVGPSNYFYAWNLHKLSEINLAAFQPDTFVTGYSFMSTVLVEQGMLGFLAWIVFAALMLWVAYKVIVKLYISSDLGPMIMVVFATVYGIITLFLFNVSFVYLMILFVFAGYTLGIAYTHKILKTSYVKISPKHLIPVKWTTRIIVAVAFVMLLNSVLFNVATAKTAPNYALKILSYTSYPFPKDYSVYYATVLANKSIESLADVVNKEELTKQEKQQIQKQLLTTTTTAVSATKRFPINYKTFILAGDVYAFLASLGVEDTYDLAIKFYNQSRVPAPANALSTFNSANLAFKLGRVDEAKSFATTLIKENPNYLPGYSLLSNIFIAENNVNAAVAATQQLVARNPSNALSWFKLGILYYYTKNFKAAEAAFTRAVQLVPTYSNALYYLALTNIQLGNNELALKLLKRLQVQNPNNETITKLINQLESAANNRQKQQDNTKADTEEADTNKEQTDNAEQEQTQNQE